jgi:hypothetical protein
MTNSQADMLNLKIKILGDPDYIKQDDVFYRPPIEGPNIATKPTGDPRLLPNNGSLVMDGGALYVQVLFRTPTDLDESTGLMKFDTNYKHSVFSGLYQVLTVTSHFNNGQFTQELDLIRMPRQSAFDYVDTNQNNNSGARDESGQQKQPGITPPNPTPVPSQSVGGGGSGQSQADAADTATDSTAGGDQPVSQIQNATPPVENQSQAELRNVNNTAPTQVIDANTRPPQLGNDATDAQLAENYRQKAVYVRNQANQLAATGGDPTALNEAAAQYDEWAARRQALANQ